MIGNLTKRVLKKPLMNSLRSNNQNRYFHGPVLDTLTHYLEMKLKLNKQQVKDIVKFLFLKETVEVTTQDGEVKEIEHIRPTSSLTTSEFEDFNESIRRWASQLGCDIKEPLEK